MYQTMPKELLRKYQNYRSDEAGKPKNKNDDTYLLSRSLIYLIFTSIQINEFLNNVLFPNYLNNCFSRYLKFYASKHNKVPWEALGDKRKLARFIKRLNEKVHASASYILKFITEYEIGCRYAYQEIEGKQIELKFSENIIQYIL